MTFSCATQVAYMAHENTYFHEQTRGQQKELFLCATQAHENNFQCATLFSSVFLFLCTCTQKKVISSGHMKNFKIFISINFIGFFVSMLTKILYFH